MSVDPSEPPISDADAAAPSPVQTAGSRRTRGSRRDSERPLWQQLVINLLLALVVVSLVQAFVVRVHNVASGSMLNTLEVTDRVLSSKVPYLNGGPARGDIVIFSHGNTWEDEVRPPDPNPVKQAVRTVGEFTGIGPSNHLYTVKRVIGVAGDTVGCCDAGGRLTVNGQPLDEPYVTATQDLPWRRGVLDCWTSPDSSRCFGPITVPPGKLLVLGDNRKNSADSVYECRGTTADQATCARFVDASRVSGKVIARAWPPGVVR